MLSPPLVALGVEHTTDTAPVRDDGLVTLAHLDGVCLTDGGMETTLIFHHGLDLPQFAAFTLLASEEGRAALISYYDSYLAVAEARDLPIVLDTATWRASQDWGDILGYSSEQLANANREAVLTVRTAIARRSARAVLSGAVGHRGDGYVAERLMTAAEAHGYHEPQVWTLADAGVDLVSAITMTYAEEAIGVARAAADAGAPAVISFTVETDGTLPSGQALADAVAEVDDATGGSPAYYMVNCAHPTHFAHVLDGSAPLERIRGVRPNASAKSHAELDEATELDMGDPDELAAHVASLRSTLPRLTVFGGCCGTDHRHIAALAEAMGS
jgi:S-methylmethionine-dependent homocysteine/selenocysteine methylase